MITELIILGAVTGAVKYSSKDRKLSDYELMLGYKNLAVLRKPIIVNMKVTPHIFITSLRSQFFRYFFHIIFWSY